jgi:hypothetical protein
MFRDHLGATTATATEGAFAGSDNFFNIDFRSQKSCIFGQTNDR